MKTKTLIVSDSRIKELFKSETAKNGLDMSEVTQELWKQYILTSVKARKERYAVYLKNGQNGES